MNSKKNENWKVYFGEGFWGHHRTGKKGIEISVNKSFTWNGNEWYIPSVYACGQGLVIDFCAAIEPEKIKAFLEKVELYGYREDMWSEEVKEEMHRSNPTDISFDATVFVNGKELSRSNCCGFGYVPPELLPEGAAGEEEAKAILEHYGLDNSLGWSFHRASFPWATVRKPKIAKIKLSMEVQPTAITGPKFKASDVGEKINFVHPVTGVEHTLTLGECEPQILDTKRMEELHRGEFEYPSHFQRLIYTVEPELSGLQFSIQDVNRGDSPKLRPKKSDAFLPTVVASIGVIGRTDGLTAIFVASGSRAGKPRAACSSLYFEPVEEVQWKMIFHEKLCEGITVDLSLD